MLNDITLGADIKFVIQQACLTRFFDVKSVMNNENCIFFLQVNKMSMVDGVDNDPMRFMLKDITPGADIKFVIQAPSEEIKKTWVSAIQRYLEMAGDFLRGNCKYIKSHTLRKPVFGDSDEVRYKPGCTATEDS